MLPKLESYEDFQEVHPNPEWWYMYGSEYSFYWLYCGHRLLSGSHPSPIIALPANATEKWEMIIRTFPYPGYRISCEACKPAMDALLRLP